MDVLMNFWKSIGPIGQWIALLAASIFLVAFVIGPVLSCFPRKNKGADNDT